MIFLLQTEITIETLSTVEIEIEVKWMVGRPALFWTFPEKNLWLHFGLDCRRYCSWIKDSRS